MEPYVLGIASSLLAAFSWALAVAWFRDPIARHGSWTVSLGKNVLGTVLLGLTTLAAGQVGDLAAASPEALFWIAASGVVGLSIGDTALFAAVAHLGPHRSLLFQTLGPVFAAVLATIFLGEEQGPARLLGTALVLAGVVLVVWKPRRRRSAALSGDVSGDVAGPDAEAWPALGISLAVLAAFGQGSGVVMAKEALEEIPTLGASFVRLLAAMLGVVVVMALIRRLRPAMRVFGDAAALRRLAGPAFLGTYVAFLLMMGGIALAPASVAAVLLATPPVFSLFVDARLFGTPITARGVAGTLLSVLGVAILGLYG